MNGNKISVIIATYNGEKFLKEQFDSIKNQTFVPDEVIIRDDGSTDGTVEFIEKYIEKYNLKSWKIIRNIKNLGWRKNFIQLLQDSTGEIIFLSDQDDVWDLNKIEKMYIEMENRSEVLLCSCNYRIINQSNKKVHIPKYKSIRQENLDKVILTKKIEQLRPGNTYAVRRMFLPYIYRFFKINENIPHDSAIEYSAKLLNGMYILPETLTSWRIHGDSTFSKEEGSKALINYFDNMIIRYSSSLKFIEVLPKKRVDSIKYYRHYSSELKGFENARKYLIEKKNKQVTGTCDPF